MFRFPFFFFCLLCTSLLAQDITLENYNLTIHTDFKNRELQYVDSLLHDSPFTIELVKLLPECPYPNRCFPNSIILENYQPERQLSDSLDIFDAYFTGVKQSLIDPENRVAISTDDYPFFIQQLLAPTDRGPESPVLMCYEPRHAVLFYNEKKEIIAVHEICFECKKTIVGIYTSRYHESQTELFKHYFRKYGLLP